MSKKGDYAVRSVIFLARAYGDGRRKKREIAGNMGIPELFLPQVLAILVHEGLIRSVAGPGGGYELARSPEEITLYEVVSAADGPLQNERCLMRGGACDPGAPCLMHGAWSDAQDAVEGSLARVTIADLLAGRVAPPLHPHH